MSRRSARHNTASLSLFPFLAVLICAIGALILVLVSLSEYARQQAEQASAIQGASAAGEAHGQAEIIAWRIDQWRATKAATEQQLADRRLELSQVEDHTRRLRDEAAELLRAAEQLQRTASGADQQQSATRDDLSRLQAQIAEAEVALAHRSERPAVPASYAIVPYQGPSGTRRRPLYIECRAEAIILQPEGIVLRESDFQAGLGPGNPLAAALRAAREHLLRNRSSSLAEPGEPYPLLLVRPAGIGSYYVAQAALKSWGSEFGYELIDDDWKLEFWQPNAELATIEHRVVEEARERQRSLVLAAPRRFRPGDRPSFRVESGLPSGGPGSGRGYRGSGIGNQRGEEIAEVGEAENPYSALGGTGRGGGNGTQIGDGTVGERGGGGVAGSPVGGNTFSDEHSGKAGTFDQESQESGTSSQASRGAGGQPAGGQAIADASTQTAATSAQSSRHSALASGSGSASSPGDPSTQQSAGAAIELRPGEFRPREKSNLRSMAERRGANWALPDATDKAFPIARPIRIVCNDDHLTILPDGKGPRSGRTIPLGSQTGAAVDELVSGVWDHMKGWGIAGQGLYWKPILVMEITPAAGQRYADLRALLSNSGLEIHEKPAGQPTRR